MLTQSPADPETRGGLVAWATLASAALAVGTAAWLVPATVRIVGWSGGVPQRIALLPPLSRLSVCMAVAVVLAGIGAIRARRAGTLPRLARAVAPLLLLLLWAAPYLPWASRSPLLLVFSGPLRWVVACIAVAASGGTVVDWRRVHIPKLSSRAVFAASLIVYAAFGARFAERPGLGGDQPHYLVITHSLLVDHDLDIGNNHERRDYRAFFGGLLRPDYLQRGRRGEIYSVHAPGLPALLLPAYALAGARGAVVFLALFAAVAAAAVFDLATAIGGPATGALVWAAVCLTIPFAPHAWLVYPELPAALIVALSVRWIWQGSGRPVPIVLHGMLLALLPWLHTKFIILLAALAVVESIRLRPRAKRIVLFLAPIAIGTAAWLASFYWMYGTFDPRAPYGASATLNVAVSNVPHGTLGLLFDKKFGLLVYSPVYALAAVGIGVMFREKATRWFAAALTLTAVVFIVSTTRFYMWWGGSSAPARFLVPLTPLAAPALAAAIGRMRGAVSRPVVVLLLLTSVGAAWACVLSPGAGYLFSDPHGPSAFASAVQGGAPLDSWLPTFTEEQWHPDVVQLLYWLVAVAVTIGIVVVAVRLGAAGSGAGVVTVALFAFVTAAAALPGSRSGYSREALALQGRLSLMRDYDASRLRAADVGRLRRLTEPALLSALTLEIPSADAEGTGGILSGPYIDLPAGEFEARIWFANRTEPRRLRAELPHAVVIARAVSAFDNPAVLRFRMAVAAPVRIAAEGSAPQRTEIEPVRLPAGSARSPIEARAIDAVDGPPGSYIAYEDDRSYPEGGVYWTSGTDTSRVLLVAGAGNQARLVLHVGPNAGRVVLRVGGQQQDVEMTANETRQIVVSLSEPGQPTEISVRATHAFRPSATDPGSDDQRSLGCQVRPIVR